MPEFTEEASLAKDRRKASADWLTDNYYGEWIEAYKSSKCLTNPIYVKDPKTGKKKEDKTRTNIAGPEIARLVHQKTARKIVNPPHIAYLCDDEATAMKLTTWRYQQYDRSGEDRKSTRLNS